MLACYFEPMRIVLLFLFLGLLPAHSQPESAYIERWCAAHSGESEVTLRDGTRADCITPSGFAVEVERASAWKSGIGQALHYARLTGEQAKMVVIVGPGDKHYLRSLNDLIEYYGLPIVVVAIPKLEPPHSNTAQE